MKLKSELGRHVTMLTNEENRVVCCGACHQSFSRMTSKYEGAATKL